MLWEIPPIYRSHEPCCLKQKKEALAVVKLENHAVAKKRTGKNGVSKKIAWAKAHTAKALEETANQGRRMGQLDELEKYFKIA